MISGKIVRYQVIGVTTSYLIILVYTKVAENISNIRIKNTVRYELEILRHQFHISEKISFDT